MSLPLLDVLPWPSRARPADRSLVGEDRCAEGGSDDVSSWKPPGRLQRLPTGTETGVGPHLRSNLRAAVVPVRASSFSSRVL
jgi:hypothetical protein